MRTIDGTKCRLAEGEGGVAMQTGIEIIAFVQWVVKVEVGGK